VVRPWSNLRKLKAGVRRRGCGVTVSVTPILPVRVGDAALAFEFSKKLFEAGVFAPAVGYPIFAEGKARLRTIVSAAHKREQLLRAANILGEVGKSLGVV